VNDDDDGLQAAAETARDHAGACLNPSCHAVANALDSVLTARQWRRDRDNDPHGRTDGIPPPPIDAIHIRKPRDPTPPPRS
jgi:hypothetical protein